MKKCSICMFFVLSFLFFNLFTTAMADTQQVRLIIFPFQNINQDKADDWIGNGFSETLTTSLSSVHGLMIVERSQLKNVLKEQTFAQTAYIDQKTAVEMGKIASANVVVVGSFQKINNQIRINSRFVDVKTGLVQKEHVADIQGKMDDIFTLQNQLADKIIMSFNAQITPEESQRVAKATHGTNSLKAYEEYIKGKEILDQMKPSSAEKAIEHFKKSIESDPSYAMATAYLSIAYTTFYHNQIAYNKNVNVDEYKAKASDYANKALALDSNLPETHRALASVYFLDKKKDKAVEELKIALKLNPNNIECIIFYLNLEKKDFESRLDELTKYTAIDNENPLLLLSIGSIYTGKSIQAELMNNKNEKEINIKQAILYFERILKKNPNNYMAHFYLSQVYDILKDKNKQDYHIKQILSLEPDSYFSYSLLGSFYFQQKKWEEAEKAYKKSIELNPDYSSTYWAIGNVYKSQEKNELALENYKIAIKYNPQSDTTYSYISEIYADSQKYDQAEAILKEGLKYNPYSLTLHNSMSYIYVRTNRWEEAAKEYYIHLELIDKDESLRIVPAISNLLKSHTYYMIGINYIKMDEPNKAIDALNKGKELNPADKKIYEELGDVYLKQGQYQEATNTFENLIELDSKNAKSYYKLGCSLIGLKENEKSEKSFKKALLLDPEIYIKVLDINNPTFTVYDILSDIYIKDGKYQEIINTSEKIAELFPFREEAYYNMGNAWLHLNQPDKAEKALKKAIELKPEYVKAHYNLGVVYWQLAKYKEAAGSWETTLKFDPNHKAALEWLQKAKEKIK